jgi:hypothetical protein
MRILDSLGKASLPDGLSQLVEAARALAVLEAPVESLAVIQPAPDLPKDPPDLK